MSRALVRRVTQLEVRKAAHGTGLVVLPWDQWPADDDCPAWDRILAEHPHGRIFLPSQVSTPEAWEREVGRWEVK